MEYLDLSHIENRMSVLSPLGWDLGLVKEATFMVVGAGALGNEVLKNLALLGVTKVCIVDFDIIEKSNLSKSVLYREEDCSTGARKVDVAKKRLQEINPEMNIMALNGDATIDIGLGLFRRVDVVLGCLDNRLTRLWLNRFCYMVDKPWVDGGILNLGGQMTVYKKGTTCYECSLSPKAWGNIRARNSCLTRAVRYATAGLANTTPLSASIIAALQVQEALKLVADPSGKNSLAGEQFYFEGNANAYELYPQAIEPKKGCKSHTAIETVHEATELTNQWEAGEVLDWLKKHFQDPDVAIQFHYAIAAEVKTGTTGESHPFVKPRPKIAQGDLDQFASEPGEEVRIDGWFYEIDGTFAHPKTTLEQLGVPPLHILSVISKGSKHYVELSGDSGYLKFD